MIDALNTASEKKADPESSSKATSSSSVSTEAADKASLETAQKAVTNAQEANEKAAKNVDDSAQTVINNRAEVKKLEEANRKADKTEKDAKATDSQVAKGDPSNTEKCRRGLMMGEATSGNLNK